MDIRHARHIAELVDNEKFKGFRPEIKAAFHRLHESANKGNAADHKLAQILWTEVSTWNTKH